LPKWSTSGMRVTLSYLSSLILTEFTEYKKTYIGNAGPGLGQAQNRVEFTNI